jgi:CMP-N-acetylneuraminic acid synthetase
VLLQPTSPLRRAHHIEACLELLSDVAADAVVTVRPVPDEHNPAWVYRRDAQGRIRLWDGSPAPIPRRQDLAPAFHRDGLVYVVRRDVLMEQSSLYGEVTLGHVVDDVPLVNIDTPADWVRAEACIAEVGA